MSAEKIIWYERSFFNLFWSFEMQIRFQITQSLKSSFQHLAITVKPLFSDNKLKKKSKGWFSGPIIAKSRSKVLQIAPIINHLKGPTWQLYLMNRIKDLRALRGYYVPLELIRLLPLLW